MLALAAAGTWSFVAVVPRLVVLVTDRASGGPVPPGFVTDMVAAGAMAGCVTVGVGHVVGVTVGHGRARILTVGAAGTLAVTLATFLLAGARIPGWWPDGTAAGSVMGVGLAAGAVLSTAVGLALGLGTLLGPTWLRACAGVFPILCAQSALGTVLWEIPGGWLGTSWFQAVLVGGVLGSSVVAGRPRTWAMWAPALALVWFGQSLLPAIPAATQQVRAGVEVLRAYPAEPLLILGEHLGLTLLDPDAHGPAAMWVLAVVVGAAVAGWRLRDGGPASAGPVAGDPAEASLPEAGQGR